MVNDDVELFAVVAVSLPVLPVQAAKSNGINKNANFFIFIFFSEKKERRLRGGQTAIVG